MEITLTRGINGLWAYRIVSTKPMKFSASGDVCGSCSTAYTFATARLALENAEEFLSKFD